MTGGRDVVPRLARLAGAAVAAAGAAAAALRIGAAELRWGDRPAWLAVLGVALVGLALRIALQVAAVRRGALPWPRLLLPAIFWVEGAGLWWGDGGGGWRLARPATAIVLELAFIAIAIRALRRATGDELAEDRLARPLAQLLPPRAARLIAFELVILGSAFGFLLGGWRRPLPPGFVYHRDSPLRMLLPLLPLLGAGDVLLLELVILPHAPVWLRVIVHVVAIYGLVWLVGLWASFRRRPHVIAGDRIRLHRGVLCHVEVPLAAIASIGPMPEFSDDWKRRAYRRKSIRCDLAGAPVLELRLHAPVVPIGVLGPGRPGDRVLVSVDDPEAFRSAIAAARTA